MTLSAKAVDRIFERLTATYGRAFMAQWDGVPESDVKAVWAHELAGFGQSKEHLGCIAWALENLTDAAPNVIKFRNLCRLAPMPEAKRLEAPKADPERVAVELARLSSVRGDMGPRDPKDWARRVLAREAAGECLKPAIRACAYGALDMAIGRAA